MTMLVSLEQLERWLKAREDEHLEFKEAKARFDFEVLVRYCAALANEGGGHMLLGVSDKPPRQIVGSTAFENLERTRAGLVERLHIRIESCEVLHPDGRVVVFSVPSRPLGMPIQYQGAYWMRSGESLVPMTPDQLKAIFAEAGPDFSAERCPGAAVTDLDPAAIERFRVSWLKKSHNRSLEEASALQLLEDAELVIDGLVTYAALILFGTRKALGRFLAQSEVIFEYRTDDASIAFQQRKEYREGFLNFNDELWETINLRNTVTSYQEGLFRWDISTFNEIAVREAILNAVSHRDYRLSGSIFVRQWPALIEIVSPGGFPPGITAENMLFRQNPRNRRLAEAFARCGMVERSGQGADRMFEVCVKEGKLPPDFLDSDDHQVSLTLHGEVRDQAFVQFLEQLTAEKQATIGTFDLVVLDAVHRDTPVPERLRDRLKPLCELGALERVGKRYLLSERFYRAADQRGAYTRKRGLDREHNKALLLQHIERNRDAGSPFGDFLEVLPGRTRDEIKTLLKELKREGRAHVRGPTKGARWFPGPEGAAAG